MKRYFNMKPMIKPIRFDPIKPDISPSNNFLRLDSDGDGLPDKLDCEPFNKHKQGILHTAGAFIARKTGNEEKAKRFEKAGEISDYNKKGEAELRAEERAEEKKRLDKVKEETRLRQREASIKAREESIRTAPERKAERQAAFKEKISKVVASAKTAGQNAGKSKPNSNSGGFMSNAQSNTNAMFGMGGMGSGMIGNKGYNPFGNEKVKLGGMDIMNPNGRPKSIRKVVRKSVKKAVPKVKIVYRNRPKRSKSRKSNKKYVVVNGKKYWRK